jgi:Flp pilus assembly protein TadG
MNKVLCRCRDRLSQSGTAAIEFALVFPMLLALTYGAIVYGYTYVLQQSINFAAQQGAQVAVATVPTASASGTLTAQLTNAATAVTTALNWLPAGQAARVSVPTTGATNCYAAGVTAPTNAVTIEVSFNLSGLFPVIANLPMGIGTFPPLPSTLRACAVAYT